MEAPIRHKLVVVGDGACGKTALLTYFASGDFIRDFTPTFYTNHIVDVTINGRSIQLELHDTAGQDEYARLRTPTYANANVLLICFSFDSPESLESIESKWAPEVLHYCSDPPFPYLLVGCMADLKDDPNILDWSKRTGQTLITTAEAEKVARRIGAKAYLECSAKRGNGVDEVLERAAVLSLEAYDHKERRKCLIL